MRDNSPEYFERLKGYYGSVETISEDRRKELSEAFNAAAALARENAELRESFIASGCAIHETGTDVYVQNARAESSESANRALQAEVDRLRDVVERKNATLHTILANRDQICRPEWIGPIRNRVRDAIAYTGTETPSEKTP